jgi:hypothetical protein
MNNRVYDIVFELIVNNAKIMYCPIMPIHKMFSVGANNWYQVNNCFKCRFFLAKLSRPWPIENYSTGCRVKIIFYTWHVVVNPIVYEAIAVSRDVSFSLPVCIYVYICTVLISMNIYRINSQTLIVSVLYVMCQFLCALCTICIKWTHDDDVCAFVHMFYRLYYRSEFDCILYWRSTLIVVEVVKFWFVSMKYKPHCPLSSNRTYSIFLEPAYCRPKNICT